jgi:exodeoxyribonuclease-5
VQEVYAYDDLATEIRIKSLEDDRVFETFANNETFSGGYPEYDGNKEMNYFDYGYALTVHKAQGSQWGRVLIFDESKVFKQNSQKHLYTAITRAEEEVCIIQTA